MANEQQQLDNEAAKKTRAVQDNGKFLLLDILNWCKTPCVQFWVHSKSSEEVNPVADVTLSPLNIVSCPLESF